MRRISIKLVWFLALLFALPFSLAAQQSSGLTGVVTDHQGKVIPGVAVKLSNAQTGFSAETLTSDQGVYQFVKVPPGSGYAVSFTMEKFSTVTVTEMSLGVGITETRNVQLEVGTVTQAIEVKASGEATLNTTDATIGSVLDPKRVRDLPTLVRNSPAVLLSLQPGVIANTGGGTNRDGTVTGARTDQGNITIDGIDANDIATGQAFATVGNAPIDSLQEFRTTSAIPGASDGTASGAQVAIVTKGGTNQFHGSAYEFNRNTLFAANSWFNDRNGVAKPTLNRNQFGASLGGPVLKDRLFFFFNYEGRREASQDQNVRTVPLDHVRSGGIAYVNNSAGCGSSSRLNTTPNCITILTPAQIAALDPQHVGADAALLSFWNGRYPHANDLTAGDGINTGGFRFNSPFSRADNTYVSRVDLNITSKQKFFARWNIVREQNTDDVNTTGQQFPGDPPSGLITQRDYSFAFGHTYTINSNMINQLTVGLSKSVLGFPRDFRPTFPNSFSFGSGLTNPFPGFSFQFRQVPVPTYRDDFTYIHGNHTIQFGGNFKPNKQVSSLLNDFNAVAVGLGGNTQQLNASLRPANILTTSTSTSNWDAFFTSDLGRFASVGTTFNYTTTGTPLALGTGSNRNFHYNDYELYVQDTWRIRNDLTLTYGTRWSYEGVPFEANGFQTIASVSFNDLLSARIANSAVGSNVAPNLVYNLGGKANGARGYFEPDLNNWGPRLGIAYNPSFKEGFLGKVFGDRKTVVRAGGAIVYDRIGTTITFISDQVSYLFNNSAVTNFGTADPTATLLNDPRFSSISQSPATNVPPPITRPVTPFVINGIPVGTAQNQNNYLLDSHFKAPEEYTFGLGVQRDLPGNFIFELDYVGRMGRKLFSEADAAQIVDFKDPASGQSMITALTVLQTQLQAGTSVTAVTAQPWLENQLSAALVANNVGRTCANFVTGRTFPNCTSLAAFLLGARLQIGNATSFLRNLVANNLLLPNIGLAGQFDLNAYVTNQGASDYNGMLVSLRKRFSHGLQFDLNYTLSHSIDNNSSVVNTAFGGQVCDVRNPRVCRGNSDFDATHAINSNWVYELPVGRGRAFGGDAPRWLDAIIGGWEVSGLWFWRSGFAFGTSTSGFSTSFNVNSPAFLTGSASALATNPHTAGTGSAATLQYFSDPTAALAALNFPLVATTGSRNTLRGPGYWDVDSAVLKNFRMPWSESHRLQFRWESFNLFNHPNFVEPGTNINTPSTFGVITTQRGASRQMQFALRYDF